MESYINEKGEMVIIKTMDNFRLINAIAKYAGMHGKDHEIVKALKAEAIFRLTQPKEE